MTSPPQGECGVLRKEISAARKNLDCHFTSDITQKSLSELANQPGPPKGRSAAPSASLFSLLR